MTLRETWEGGATRLRRVARLPEAPLEAEILLRHALGLTREQLFSRWQEEIAPEGQAVFQALLSRRLAHEPTAYIIGQREFYGLDFSVDHRALIPRPESELLVEKALELARPHPPQALADVGTGCGAIAIALAHHLPQALIYATDLSPSALELAHINLERHHLEERVRLLGGDLLEPLPGALGLVVANLPYIPTAELFNLPPEVRLYEPLSALDGGGDGLGVMRHLLSQLPDKLASGGSVLLEVGAGQADAVAQLVRRHLSQAQINLLPDLAGIPRVVQATTEPQSPRSFIKESKRGVSPS